MRPKTLILITAACVSASMPSMAEADAVAGAIVFKKCQPCHDAVEGKNKVGPHLVGVVGRTAGTLDSFFGKYSTAMVDAGASGLVWDEANLAAYLKAPREFLPGGRMAFAGLKQDADVTNVIAYLKAAEKPQ